MDQPSVTHMTGDEARTSHANWDEVYWRALTQASPDIILVVEPDGTILFTNVVIPAFMASEVVGRKIWDFALGEDAATLLRTKLAEVVRSKKAVVYEHPGRRSDGSQGWYEVRAIPVVVEGEVRRVLWVSSDSSKRKGLEEQLRQAQKMEAIGLFAGGVAHDFNNILAVILSSSDYAAKRHGGEGPLGPILADIADAARRGGELTRRLLALSGTQVIRPRVLDLGAATMDFAQMLRRIVGDDVRFEIRANDAPLIACVDLVQIEQVLMNLCANARQAMPSGGELHVSTGRADYDATFVEKNPWARVGAFAEITVRDTGQGMDPATLARAFEPFFTTKPSGTGLGLAAVHGIVDQHGGFVHVESREGGGTTFRVYVPRTAEPGAEPK
jgi:PAS domain S-box-containing protein